MAAARHDTAAAQAAQHQARSLLISATAQAYFQLQNAQSQSAAIADIVDKLQEVLSITRQRHDNGLGTQVDVDQAQSAVSSARVQLGQVRNTAKLLHHQLAALLGRRAERDAAIAQYNQTVLDAVREVADARSSLLSLREQTRHQEASLQSISSAYDIARQRYRAGLGDFIQVLMAQSEMLKQAVQTVDLRAQAYLLDIQLATALGGGYTSPEAS